MIYELWPPKRTPIFPKVHVVTELSLLLYLPLSLDCREILLPLMTEQLKFHLDKEEEPRACCQLLSDVLEVLYRKDVVRMETHLNAFYQPLPLFGAALYLLKCLTATQINTFSASWYFTETVLVCISKDLTSKAEAGLFKNNLPLKHHPLLHLI